MTDAKDPRSLSGTDPTPSDDPARTAPAGVAGTLAIGDMSPRDFARLGLNKVAYVRAVAPDDPETDWAIHAANGQRIGVAPSSDLAFAATRQHDMEPLRVH